MIFTILTHISQQFNTRKNRYTVALSSGIHVSGLATLHRPSFKLFDVNFCELLSIGRRKETLQFTNNDPAGIIVWNCQMNILYQSAIFYCHGNCHQPNNKIHNYLAQLQESVKEAFYIIAALQPTTAEKRLRMRKYLKILWGI